MATGLRPFVISLVMVIIGTFFIIAFAFSFIQQTNPNSEVFDSKYGMNSSINHLTNIADSFGGNASSIYTQMGDAQPSATDYLFLIFQGAFYIPYTLLAFAFSAINILISIIVGAIGGTEAVSSLKSVITLAAATITSGLIVTLVLLIVKAIRTGESER